MPFKPGESGNPNGRPRQKPFIGWCRKWTEEWAEKVLGKIASDPKRRDQLDAIKTIMAYGVGKPVESVETSHQFEGLGTDPSDAKEFLGQLIVGAAQGGTGEGPGGGGGAGDDPPPLLDAERCPGERDS